MSLSSKRKRTGCLMAWMGCELRMSPLSGSSSFRDPSSSSSTAQEQEQVKNDKKLITTGIRILMRT
jgi:hypothetical protein